MIKCLFYSKEILKILSYVLDTAVEDFQIDRLSSIDFLSDSSRVFIWEIMQYILFQIGLSKNLLVVIENPQLLTKNYIKVKKTKLEMEKLLPKVNYSIKKYEDSLYFKYKDVEISDTIIIKPFVFVNDEVIIGEISTYDGNPDKDFKLYIEKNRKYEFFIDNYDRFSKFISEVIK